MADDKHFGRGRRHDLPSTPWSEGTKHVLMTEQAWMIYHSAWIVCFQNHCMPPDYIDVYHMHRAAVGGIVFG